MRAVDGVNQNGRALILRENRVLRTILRSQNSRNETLRGCFGEYPNLSTVSSLAVCVLCGTFGELSLLRDIKLVICIATGKHVAKERKCFRKKDKGKNKMNIFVVVGAYFVFAVATLFNASLASARFERQRRLRRLGRNSRKERRG